MFESIKKFLNRKTDRAYDKLINSEAYLNSKYKIRYIDKYNLYAIIDTDLDRYVDIVFFNTYKWRRDSVFFKDCLCTKKESILYYKNIRDVKDIPKITDYQKLDEIDFKSIEKYVRDKKLKNLNKNIRDVKDKSKITDYEKLDEINFKSIEKYVRDKKLKNLNKN